ncbi:hypothetical protein D3C76_1755670 [compost metagenome]
MRARLVINVEHFKIEVGTAGADTDHEAPFGNMVEPTDAMRQFRRVMERQHKGPGCQFDALGFEEGLCDQQVR